MQPLLSIVISVYNAEITIRKAIASILTQKFDDWEIILVNDGSTDSCPQIIDDYAKSDTRIKAFHKKNEGPYSGFNLGIEKAIGKYITFMGADDTYEQDALQIIANQAAEYNYDMIFILLNIIECDDEQNIIKISERQSLPQKWENGMKITNKKDVQSFWIIFLYNKIIANNTNVYKASIIKKYKYRAIRYGEDHFLNIDLADEICSVSCNPKPIYNNFIYVNNNSLNISINKYHVHAHAMFNEYYIKYKELLTKWNLNNDHTYFMMLSEIQVHHYLIAILSQIFAPNNSHTPKENIDIVTGYYDDIIFETANNLNYLDKIDNQFFNIIGNITLQNKISSDFDNPIYRMFTALNNTTISFDRMKSEITHSLLDYSNPYRIGFEVYKTLSTQFIKIANAELLDYLQTEQIARKWLFTGNFEQALDTTIQLFNSKISTPEQYVILARCGYHLGLTEDAKNAVETGLQLFPNYPRLEELQNIINTERNE
ncbi:MAG: glycosyltransferase [Firmicutes bacterium]|nr:glycosyltransferase [Bacillota bacterium]